MGVDTATDVMLELKDAGGRPEKAGWLLWDDISEEWGEDEVEIASPYHSSFTASNLT